MEQPRHACSGQPNTPGSKKARYTTNCGRASNKSSRLTLPLGPSNSYFLSTASQGIRRRSAASASRERVKAFSFTKSCWCAASHSSCDTIGGVFFAISSLLRDLKQTETIRCEKCSELADAQGQNSSGGCGSGNHYCCGCETCWAHMSLLAWWSGAIVTQVSHGLGVTSVAGFRWIHWFNPVRNVSKGNQINNLRTMNV